MRAEFLSLHPIRAHEADMTFPLTGGDANGEDLSQSWSSRDDGETVTRTYGNDIPGDGNMLIQFWSQSVNAEIPNTVDGLPVKLE